MVMICVVAFASFMDAIANLFKRNERNTFENVVSQRKNRRRDKQKITIRKSANVKIDAILDQDSSCTKVYPRQKRFLFKAGKE